MKLRASNRVSENGSPSMEPIAFYEGSIMHQRMKPAMHRFQYRVFTILLDIDRLSDAAKTSSLFSVNKFNLLSFHEKDHGRRDGTGLRQHIDDLLAEINIDKPARVLLLAYPRLLGYGFNPLSVYYSYDKNGSLSAIVYEVRNTFGELHTYVEAVLAPQISDAGVRHTRCKQFYVSPFIDMEQTYHFRMLPPGETVRVRILEKDPLGPLLSATFSGAHQNFTTKNLLKLCTKIPFLTLKVIAAIHYEAFKLWRKRIPFHPKSQSKTAIETNKNQSQPSGLAAQK